jgi:polyisoprenoid-binding protein YceI
MKLKPMRAAFTIRAWPAIAAALLLGCATTAGKPRAQPPAAPVATQAAAVGQAYQVIARDSLLTVRVYRAGTLARAGHNHLIASHDLTGTVYVAKDLARSSFELELPVSELTVDEAALRAAEGADFAADVPDAAKEGTRRNMLGPAVLDAAQYPTVTLRSLSVDAAADPVIAQVEIRIRAERHSVAVPVSFTLNATELMASGKLTLKQSDLGLTPFSALLGALAVQDEMQLQFRIVARVQ